MQLSVPEWRLHWSGTVNGANIKDSEPVVDRRRGAGRANARWYGEIKSTGAARRTSVRRRHRLSPIDNCSGAAVQRWNYFRQVSTRRRRRRRRLQDLELRGSRSVDRPGGRRGASDASLSGSTRGSNWRTGLRDGRADRLQSDRRSELDWLSSACYMRPPSVISPTSNLSIRLHTVPFLWIRLSFKRVI